MPEKENKKPFNHLAQSGKIEDLAWSILQDVASEFHLSRYIISVLRDKKDDTEDMATSYDIKIADLKNQQNSIRKIRYDKQNLLYIEGGSNSDDKQSCVFKHQNDSLATIHDAWSANLDEKLDTVYQDLYFSTSNNWAEALAKFAGIDVEACSACLFEKLKIEESRKEL